MVFEFKGSENGLMEGIANSIAEEIKRGVLVLPEAIGEGYIKTRLFGPALKMMILQYELNEDFTLKRKGFVADSSNEEITFSFRNIGQGIHSKRAVQVSSPGIDLEIFTPANTKINTIIISVNTSFLKELFNKQESHIILQNIISLDHAYLYEEMMSPGIQQVARTAMKRPARPPMRPWPWSPRRTP